MQKEPLLWKFSQVSYVVRDLKIALAEYCDAYGLGPWYIHEISEKNLSQAEYKGKPAHFTLKVALCNLESFQLELIEPGEGDSDFHEFLRTYGPGLHHIRYESHKGFDETLAAFTASGAPVILSGVLDGKERWAVTDHRKTLGICLELNERAQDWMPPKDCRVYPDGSEASPLGFSIEHPLFTGIGQVAFVVNDYMPLVKEYWDCYGIGPWAFLKIDDKINVKELLNDGKPVAEYRVNCAVCRLNGYEFEVLQPLEHTSANGKFLHEHGPGGHHMYIPVSVPYEELIALMEAYTGAPAAQSAFLDGCEHVSQFDRKETIGAVLEFKGLPQSYEPPKLIGCYPEDAGLFQY